jgi:hypothetical protein
MCKNYKMHKKCHIESVEYLLVIQMFDAWFAFSVQFLALK